MSASHATTILALLFCNTVFSQTYFGATSSGLVGITINGGNCSSQYIGDFQTVAGDPITASEIAYSPNGTLYMLATDAKIYQIDPSNGISTQVNFFNNLNIYSLTFGGNGLLYGLSSSSQNPLLAYNPANGLEYSLGNTFLNDVNDLVSYNGSLYGVAQMSISQIDLNFPVTSNLVSFTSITYDGLAIYPDQCNTLLAVNGTQLSLIHLDANAETTLCSLPYSLVGLTEAGNYQPTLPCPVAFDLDLDNSSGATGSDLIVSSYSCFFGGVQIGGAGDIFIPNYAAIQSMTVSISSGILDPGEEYFYISPSFPINPNLTLSGEGTSTLTITNNNFANISHFVHALQGIVYTDQALSPTGGQRVITINFVTKSGIPSVDAKVYVTVQEVPQIQVDLGPDMALCEGNSIDLTLDAGNPGQNYQWSNGETTQTIHIATAGTYSVTVVGITQINGEWLCPGKDEITVNILPNAPVLLGYQGGVCAGDSTGIEFTILAPGNFDLIMTASTGEVEYLNGISSGYTHLVSPSEATTYTFEQANTGISSACLELNAAASIQVYPTSFGQSIQTLCHGDSLFIGGGWQTATGIYLDTLQNQFFCDSILETTLTVLPADTSFIISQTCDTALVGSFEQVWTNINGCDSLVIQIISLLPPDSCNTVGTIEALAPDGHLKVYAPNAFSPNGDGINDVFLLFGNEQVEVIKSLKIYSQWGERVFEIFNQAPNEVKGGWDGSFRGKEMDAGAFVYMAEVLYKNGTLKIVKGNVDLLK